jgi:hypothetical protein
MYHKFRVSIVLCALSAASTVLAQQSATENQSPSAAPAAESPAPAADHAALEQAFSEMLSGATLEGTFTSTGANRDPSKLSREKYTIGQVRKIAGNLWLIPARIQYGDRDVTVPVPAPIRWAGDTPVIVVDNIPGFENMSARVLFYADHYAGYWRHGDHGGHLFGTITRGEKPAESTTAPSAESSSSVVEPAAGEQRQK